MLNLKEINHSFDLSGCEGRIAENNFSGFRKRGFWTAGGFQSLSLNVFLED